MPPDKTQQLTFIRAWWQEQTYLGSIAVVWKIKDKIRSAIAVKIAHPKQGDYSLTKTGLSDEELPNSLALICHIQIKAVVDSNFYFIYNGFTLFKLQYCTVFLFLYIFV